MPLNLLNFEERGQVSVLNMWADRIEQNLNTHTNQIGGTNFRSANAETAAILTGNNVTAITQTNVVVQDPTTGHIINAPIGTIGRATPPHQPNQDLLDDGITYARVLATALTSNAIDSTKPGFIAQGGALPPQVVGTGSAIITYTSTTTTIDLSWSSFNLAYADLTNATVSSGSQNVTGLTANTTYYFYPYVTSGLVVAFAIVSGGTGSPAIMYATQSPIATQVQNSQTVTAVNGGGIAATTPVSGSGGGSGGGTHLCIHDTMIVNVKEQGYKPIGECKIGDWIEGRYDWTQIQNIRLVNQTHFIRFETDYGCVEVTPTHCITTGLEESKPASTVSLSDYLIRRDGYANIKCIKLIHIPDAQKVVLHCEPEHVFWAGEHKPELLVHNFVPLS
jgi:hypothetical protein